MSLNIWKKKFYPKEPIKNISNKVAIDHSIQKWIGLKKENLFKHDLKKFDNESWIDDKSGENPTFDIDGSTCALCIRNTYNDIIDCTNCPLFIARGNVQCDEARIDEELSPFDNWRINSDPESMLAWLYKAKAETK